MGAFPRPHSSSKTEMLRRMDLSNPSITPAQRCDAGTLIFVSVICLGAFGEGSIFAGVSAAASAQGRKQKMKHVLCILGQRATAYFIRTVD